MTSAVCQRQAAHQCQDRGHHHSHWQRQSPDCAGASQQVGQEYGGTEWAAGPQLGHARPATPDGECHPVRQPCSATGDLPCCHHIAIRLLASARKHATLPALPACEAIAAC